VSAIFGIVRFDGADVSASDLERMGNTMAHRGPDGREVAVDGAVGLGHCLMRVNKEDMFEAQPLRDREGDLTLVADLRLDNREELAAIFGIGTAQLRDMPDSALVLRAYKTWGHHCAEHLLGDFAFAIWDGRAKKLVLGRDHMGQRYFVYHRAKDFFAFATEVNALWAIPGVPRELSEAMIGRELLLAPALSSNATRFSDIFFLFGGSILIVGADGRTAEHRYWEPRANPDFLNRMEETYVEQYRSVLTEAVECRIRRLIAPPALSLSAGYDTAAIAGLSGPVLTAQGRKLIAVSSVMAEDYDGPLRHARRWVELCRRDMPHLDVRYFVRTNENDLAHFEEACLRQRSVPGASFHVTDILFQQASSAGAHLLMDGFGGDVTLNPRGGGILCHFLRKGQILRFLSEARAHHRKKSRSLKTIVMSDIVVGLAPFWLRRGWRRLRYGATPPWHIWPIAPHFGSALIDRGTIDVSEVTLPLQPYVPPRTRSQRTLHSWTTTPPTGYANLAAAHGLDIARPMLDKRAIEFGLSIPEELYVKDGRDRYLACRALAGVYPAEFQTRPPSQDPRDPDYARMLRAELPTLKADIERLAQNATLRNYIDFKKVRTALSDLHAGEYGIATDRAMRAIRIARYIAWFQGENRYDK
jgi:asparagine synthase (glutamine-hydrolysing)